MVIIDGTLVAVSLDEITIWQFDRSSLQCQADLGTPSTDGLTGASPGSRSWMIDSAFLKSTDATTLPIAILPMLMPDELCQEHYDGANTPHLIFPGRWYLPAMHFPLEFDILTGFRSRLDRVHGVRYRLSKATLSHSSATHETGEFRLEILSKFMFPHSRVVVEAEQIPGYFVAGMSLPVVDDDGHQSEIFDNTFVYEPSPAGSTKGELESGSDEENFRDVRLSKVYSHSVLSVNSCVSGVSAYRSWYETAEGDAVGGVSIVDYPEET